MEPEKKQEQPAVPEVESPEVETPSEPELTEIEQRALEKGWKPKKVWVEEGGDPDEWRSAREFEDRGVMMDRLHQQNRELKNLRESFSALQRFQANLEQRAYNKAMRELKAERRAAMREEDPDRVEQIEEQMQTTQQEFAQVQAAIQKSATVQQPEDPQFTAWKSRNTWYTSDAELKRVSDGFGIAYFSENPGASPAEVLRYVETEVKKRYPEKFGSRRAAPNPVARPDKTNRGTGRSSDADTGGLSEEERQVMDTLVRGGHMTKAEYLAELKKYK